MSNFQPQLTDVVNTFLVSDMLEQGYRMAGALLHPGQGISPSESAEGLGIANSMIDGMKIEGLLIIFTRRTLQTMNIGQKDYGVGPGQDFDIPRPPKIHRAGFIIGTEPGDAEIPMDVLLTFEQYAEFTVKNTGCGVPLAFYYQGSVPYGTFTVWPVPNLVSQIAVYTPVVLSEFSTVDDAMEMPYGYREMLEYNLAVRVHQRYPGKAMDPSVRAMAVETKARVKNNQWTPLFIGSDKAAMQENRRSWCGGTPKAWTPY